MIQKTLNDIKPSLVDRVKAIAQEASTLQFEEKVNFLNEARRVLHDISPFSFEPIDFVEWVPAKDLKANDWNPNKMADNEVEMLDGSMIKYGMAQAIVSTHDETIIDGWHRNWRGSAHPVLSERMYHYLPIVRVKGDEADQREATLIFNETKGTHYIEKEGAVIRDLVELGRADEDISKNLGKSFEEIVRLKQITGIAASFANKQYSKAWGELDDEMEIR